MVLAFNAVALVLMVKFPVLIFTHTACALVKLAVAALAGVITTTGAVAKHPFSYLDLMCIYILLKNLLYTQISSKLAYTHPDKLATHNIMPFCILYIFVRYADFLNCQIVKLLKSPNGANIVCVGLTVVELKATGEILEPRVVVVADLRRTPIVVTRKTPNGFFLYIKQIKFIFCR